jgi:mxaJ protein
MKTTTQKYSDFLGLLFLVIIIAFLPLKGHAAEDWIDQNMRGPAKGKFRVCADPNNLPYSNEKLEGFENKIAELLAKEFSDSPTYFWWPQRRGFLRGTLGANMCDIIMGVPKEYDPVLVTKSYYRTTYVIAYLKNKGLQVKSLDDPVFKEVKIGVYINTPPHVALNQRGIFKNLVSYELFYDSQDNYPGKIMDDLVAGRIDIALVWGAIAGYFAKKQSVPIEIVPIPKGEADSLSFIFDMSMGVRRSDKELKAKLEEILNKKQTEIQKILEDYGVPLIAEKEEAK